MPAPLRYDLLVYQGEDYRRSIPELDTSTKQPADVTGWTVKGQIRDGYGPTAALLHELDVTVAGTDLILEIPGIDSAGWEWRLARYDIKLTAPDTTPTRIMEGSVVVYPQVTQAS